MGVKAMIRNTEKSERLALAQKFLDRYWLQLTVRQANFLSRYVAFNG